MSGESNYPHDWCIKVWNFLLTKSFDLMFWINLTCQHDVEESRSVTVLAEHKQYAVAAVHLTATGDAKNK